MHPLALASIPMKNHAGSWPFMAWMLGVPPLKRRLNVRHSGTLHLPRFSPSADFFWHSVAWGRRLMSGMDTIFAHVRNVFSLCDTTKPDASGACAQSVGSDGRPGPAPAGSRGRPRGGARPLRLPKQLEARRQCSSRPEANVTVTPTECQCQWGPGSEPESEPESLGAASRPLSWPSTGPRPQGRGDWEGRRPSE